MAETLAEQAERERQEALAKIEEDQAETDRRMGADEFVVTAPYVTLKVKDATGAFVVSGFNEGAVVKKDDIDEANLRHHVETRLVAPKDSDEAKLAGPAGTPKPGEPPNVPVEEVPVTSLPLDERQRRQQAALEDAQKRQAPAKSTRSKSDSDNG